MQETVAIIGIGIGLNGFSSGGVTPVLTGLYIDDGGDNYVDDTGSMYTDGVE